MWLVVILLFAAYFGIIGLVYGYNAFMSGIVIGANETPPVKEDVCSPYLITYNS